MSRNRISPEEWLSAPPASKPITLPTISGKELGKPSGIPPSSSSDTQGKEQPDTVEVYPRKGAKRSPKADKSIRYPQERVKKNFFILQEHCDLLELLARHHCYKQGELIDRALMLVFDLPEIREAINRSIEDDYTEMRVRKLILNENAHKKTSQ